MAATNIYIGNSSILKLAGLRDADGAYINDGTVTVTVQDTSGTEVTGTTWPKTLTYQASSNGVYEVTLPATLALTANALYHAIVTAVTSAGTAKWKHELRARNRD